MTNIFEVADWFLIHSPEVNNKKLQKLTYYAYAWFITLYNEDAKEITERFFDAKFEAWVHGAVEPTLYAKYKIWGSGVIPAPTNSTKKFSPAELNILEQVNDVYGNYNGNELEYICHQESPWINARNNLPPNEPSNNVISDKDIFNCFVARL